jgi:hypothetical protein
VKYILDEGYKITVRILREYEKVKEVADDEYV